MLVLALENTMKVNQIVNEHKKGVRAMKYAKKTKSPVPVYGPDANNAKLKPVKPVGTNADLKENDQSVQEEMPGQMIGKVASTTPDGKVNVQKPDGTTQTVDQSQLQPGENNKLSMNTPKITPGQEVDAAKTMEEGPEVPYFVQPGPQPMAKTAPKPTPIVASKLWTAITPEIVAKAEAQGFRKVTLQWNNQQVMGLEGGDQQLGSKIIVAPSDFQSMASGNTASRTAPVRESAELESMLRIAGLR